MIMGAKEPLSAYQDKSLQWLLIAIGIIIVFAAFGKVMGQSFLEQASQQGEISAGEEACSRRKLSAEHLCYSFSSQSIGFDRYLCYSRVYGCLVKRID